ncbi:pectate lyase family protein [Bordetella hinzii 5132]|uniref:right-handed parallel beta-helix repeat-containing protein n=1 Tax=Bordetella hinzii TaxID=103855 RepID=UPI00045A98D0|nr:right-handed parallel beta-helix repeat-containing protein [Bordetella hinzii]KCB41272.1 pectate lyase family protein [Bordetella hinzii 5132]
MAANTPITIQQLANAQRDATDLEHFVNDPAPAYVPTRLGGNKPNYERLVADFRTLTADMEDQFQAFLLSSGYQDLGDYAAGLQITTRNQIFWRDGELYRAAATLSLPYTASGDWEAEGESFVAVGDAALRQEIAQPSGSTMVGFQQLGSGAVSRSAQDKMRDAVSVRDFGEVGDGVADDTAVFALALATSAKRVYVPEGVHILEGLSIPAGKTLFGPGTLKWKDAAASPMLTLAGASSGIEGLTLDGNGPAQSLDLVMVVTAAAPRAFIKDCLVTNGRYKFLLTDVAASPGVSVTGCRFQDWGTVTSCDVLGFRSPRPVASTNRFEGIGDGHCIRLGLYELDDTSVPVSGGVVAGNTFRNTQHVGVTCELFTQNLSISGNTFDNLEQGVKIERLEGTCFDISITGNTFKNLTLPTANNLQGLRVTFTGNTCIDCSGSGADMGTEGVCSGNTFLRCGDAPSNTPVIRAVGSQSDVVISNNLIIDARWRGIEVNGPDCVCSDNRVKNAADRCISVTGTNAIVSNNRTTGGTFGLLLNSSATGAVLSANNCSGASLLNYSIDDVARFSSFIADSNIGYTGGTFNQTISAGVITAPRGQNAVIVVDTEGATASDDLDSINTTGGGYVGQTIVLRSANIARAVTVKDGAQLRLAGDCALNNPNDSLTLVWTGSQWYETSRSDNA